MLPPERIGAFSGSAAQTPLFGLCSFNGSACSYTGTETDTGSARLSQNPRGCIVILRLDVGRILKLLRDKNAGISGRQFFGLESALLDALAYITVIMNKDNFRAVMTDKLASLFTHRIRHNDNRPVAADSAYKRQSYALVAAGRFRDYA